ncbi:class I lanthipeptide [Chitinophaga qingshengii]|uniref:Class I lanthipeptide n=1 Tax=Chitinophaga qingshengii TaxID=1569794 RepID=A0ABR7TGA1_9BACT|nr:class I lanthipeptide [Chitinophaga qingshengii]MBC9929453.1 class I lanthipeptide [Chitinophaga qingshengii]
MRKTFEKKLVLNKIKVAKLNASQPGNIDVKAPTYTGCSLMAKCTPPASKVVNCL